MNPGVVSQTSATSGSVYSWLLLLSFLLLLQPALAYDAGVIYCWRTNIATQAESEQEVCPQGSVVVDWLKPVPATWESEEDINAQVKVTLNPTLFGASISSNPAILHANLHACETLDCNPLHDERGGVIMFTDHTTASLTSNSFTLDFRFQLHQKAEWVLLLHFRFEMDGTTVYNVVEPSFISISQHQEEILRSEFWVRAAYAVSAAACLVVIFTMALLYHQRQHPVVRASSINLSLLILFFTLLGTAGTVLLILDPTPTLCAWRNWPILISYTGITALLNAKVYRLKKIFLMKRLKAAHNLSDGKLLLMFLLPAESISIGILCIWGFEFPLENSPYPGQRYVISCPPWTASFEFWLVVTYCILLAVTLVYLTYRTRHIHALFNESGAIFNSIRSSIIVACLMYPSLLGYGNPGLAAFLQTLTVNAVFITLSFQLFYSRMILAYSVPQAQFAKPRAGVLGGKHKNQHLSDFVVEDGDSHHKKQGGKAGGGVRKREPFPENLQNIFRDMTREIDETLQRFEMGFPIRMQDMHRCQQLVDEVAIAARKHVDAIKHQEELEGISGDIHYSQSNLHVGLSSIGTVSLENRDSSENGLPSQSGSPRPDNASLQLSPTHRNQSFEIKTQGSGYIELMPPSPLLNGAGDAGIREVHMDVSHMDVSGNLDNLDRSNSSKMSSGVDDSPREVKQEGEGSPREEKQKKEEVKQEGEGSPREEKQKQEEMAEDEPSNQASALARNSRDKIMPLDMTPSSSKEMGPRQSKTMLGRTNSLIKWGSKSSLPSFAQRGSRVTLDPSKDFEAIRERTVSQMGQGTSVTLVEENGERVEVEVI